MVCMGPGTACSSCCRTVILNVSAVAPSSSAPSLDLVRHVRGTGENLNLPRLLNAAVHLAPPDTLVSKQDGSVFHLSSTLLNNLVIHLHLLPDKFVSPSWLSPYKDSTLWVSPLKTTPAPLGQIAPDPEQLLRRSSCPLSPIPLLSSLCFPVFLFSGGFNYSTQVLHQLC